jgi:hypothetical protein
MREFEVKLTKKELADFNKVVEFFPTAFDYIEKGICKLYSKNEVRCRRLFHSKLTLHKTFQELGYVFEEYNDKIPIKDTDEANFDTWFACKALFDFIDEGWKIEEIDKDMYKIHKCYDFYVLFSKRDYTFSIKHPKYKLVKNYYEIQNKYEELQINCEEYMILAPFCYRVRDTLSVFDIKNALL